MSDLKKLFENSVLTEETQAVIEEAFNQAILAKTTELEAEYNAKLVEAEEAIQDKALDVMASAFEEEFESLKEEIVNARTLEVKYATELEEFKESYIEAKEIEIQESIKEIIEEELNEMREDIEVAKRHQFAAKLVESFGDAYQTLFGGVDMDAVAKLKEATEELDTLKREIKIAELTESLTGSKKNIAKTILESVSYDKLESKFEAILPILIKESTTDTKTGEEESTLVLESVDDEGKAITEAEQKRKQNAIYERLNRSIQFSKS